MRFCNALMRMQGSKQHPIDIGRTYYYSVGRCLGAIHMPQRRTNQVLTRWVSIAYVNKNPKRMGQ